MNTGKMTPQEKSIKLLHLMDVWVKCTNKQNSIWAVMLGDDAIATDVCPMGLRSEFAHWQHVLKTVSPNLYDPANMALAWRVLNWTGDNFSDDSIYELNKFMLGMGGNDTAFDKYIWYRDNSQTAWLDKILKLAIEAGMV